MNEREEGGERERDRESGSKSLLSNSAIPHIKTQGTDERARVRKKERERERARKRDRWKGREQDGGKE